jgi:transposase-like protein
MTKIIAKLTHDLTATAGQVLILHDNGKVFAVDAGIVDVVRALDAPLPMPKPVEAKPEAKAPIQAAYIPEHMMLKTRLRRKKIAEMYDLLLRGKTISEVARHTGLSRNTVSKHRVRMHREGLLREGPPDEEGEGHRWFKSPETLAKARERMAAIHARRMAQQAGGKP